MGFKAIILGFGGTGKELACWLPDLGYDHPLFLDDYVSDPKVLGGLELWNQHNDASFFFAMGSYRSMMKRKKILEKIPASLFPVCIAKQSTCYSRQLGDGCLVFPNSVITCDVKIGVFNLFYHNCVISHDAIIGNNNIIANGSIVSGNAKVGDNCYIGANAVVIEGIEIGNNCIIAAGSSVVHDVPDNMIYYGPKKIVENKYIS